MILQHFAEMNVCQYQLKRTPLSALSVLVFLLILYTVHRAYRELAGRNGVLCADSQVGVDRHDVSAPRVPSESDGGGLYMDVFLQITRWTNILSVAWQSVSQWSESL